MVRRTDRKIKEGIYQLNYRTVIYCAHQLEDTPSLVSKKCLNLHGHEYRVEVQIKVRKLIDDMVIDFGVIKNIVNGYDHKNLNDFLDNPTAERFAERLYTQIENVLRIRKIHPFSLQVKVGESEKGSITYSEEN